MLAAAVLLPLAGGAAAACATRENLDRGIEIETSEGMIEIFRRGGADRVHVTGMEDGRKAYAVDLARGLFALRYQYYGPEGLDPDDRTLYDFPMPLSFLPLPGERDRWLTEATVTQSDETFAEIQTYSFGKPFTVIAGPCRYAAVEIVARYSSDPELRDGLIYLPELGISYLGWWDRDGGPRFDTPPVRIEAVR